MRVVVLAAEGKAFVPVLIKLDACRGDYSRKERDADKLAQMLKVIYSCPKPTIAAIQGDVYAGGVGRSACDRDSCDLLFA